MSNADSDKHPRKRDWLGQTVGPLVLAIVLVVVGGLSARAGLDAVEQRQFELHWASGQIAGFGSISDLGDQEHASLAFHDADAVRLGIGLVALAILLFAAAGQLTARAIAPASGRSGVVRAIRALLAVVAIAALVGFSLAFFPPWVARSTFYYLAAIYIAVAHGGLRGGNRESLRGKLIFAFIVAAAGVGSYRIEYFVAMAFGFFAALVATSQLAILLPGTSEPAPPAPMPPAPAT